jgi:hypothetical protein
MTASTAGHAIPAITAARAEEHRWANRHAISPAIQAAGKNERRRGILLAWLQAKRNRAGVTRTANMAAWRQAEGKICG